MVRASLLCVNDTQWREDMGPLSTITLHVLLGINGPPVYLTAFKSGKKGSPAWLSGMSIYTHWLYAYLSL